jgi:hypothetical protein
MIKFYYKRIKKKLWHQRRGRRGSKKCIFKLIGLEEMLFKEAKLKSGEFNIEKIKNKIKNISAI